MTPIVSTAPLLKRVYARTDISVLLVSAPNVIAAAPLVQVQDLKNVLLAKMEAFQIEDNVLYSYKQYVLVVALLVQIVIHVQHVTLG